MPSPPHVFTQADLDAIASACAAFPIADIERAATRALCEGSLLEFLKAAWSSFDPAPFVSGWHLAAIAEHLEAVTRGQIRKLLINIPPRMCFPADQIIQTESGAIPIGEVVNRQLALRVPSWSEDRRRFELKPIIGWHRNPGADIYRLTFDNGQSIQCTADHRLRVAGGNWLAAADVPIGTLVSVACEPQPFRCLVPVQAFPDVMDVREDDAIPSRENLSGFRTPGDLSRLLRSEADTMRLEIKGRAMAHTIGVVLGQRSIGQVVEPIVEARAVEMASFLIRRAWPDKGQQDEAMQGAPVCSWVTDASQADQGIAVVAGRDREHLSGPAIDHAIASGLRVSKASDAAKIGDLIPGEAWHLAPDFARLVSFEHVGYAPRTYCLTIRDNHNFLAGDKQSVIVSNCKTNLVSIAWPVWTWALPQVNGNPLQGAGVRFLCASYGSNKAQGDGVTARRLIGSQWFQGLWGDRVQIAKDRDNQEVYDTLAGGSRISTGIPESLGKGGMIRIVDDPSKVDEPESERMQEVTTRAYDEVWSTRSNDPSAGAEVIIMQRLASNDLSGHVLDRGGFVHLCLPAEYDPQRHCRTVLGWSDPRTVEGEPLWPERFSSAWMEQQAELIGPFAWAGQFLQAPTPRGGGIIRDTWWMPWPPVDEEDSWMREVENSDGRVVLRTLFPSFDYILLSLDSAFSTKEENDWSALTCWGIFEDRANRPRIMLIEAWRDRLELHELVDRVKETAKRRKADAVLIEAKASGISVAQEIRRLTALEDFQVIGIDPRGDKIARLHSVVPLFSGGLVHAPARKWAQLVIDEVSAFPRGKYDDFVDSCSQALNYMRKVGLAQLSSEVEHDREESIIFRGHRQTVAEGLGL